MAEKKRKTRDEHRPKQDGAKKMMRKPSNSNQRSRKGGDASKKNWKGPILPNALRKELEILNPNDSNSDNDSINSDDAIDDLYEYEAPIPEEESKRNRRYDPVEDRRLKFDMDKDFDIGSDEGDIEDEDDDNDNDVDGIEGDDIEEEDGRHARMLEGITGLPRDAFDGKKRKKDVIVTEAYPESEYNPSRSDGMLTIQDLLDPLHGKPVYSKLRKILDRTEKSKVISTPLPKVDREKVERKVAYEFSKKDITKWEPLVKRNREAPTIYFDEDRDLGFSTVGAIASEFEPRTDFEKKMASLVNDNALVEAHRKDGARLLELNKISFEDVKDRQERLAKMRSLLFRHEIKAKRVKKIKSKTYHRLLKKDRLKAMATEIEMDPEAAREMAMKQEFRRAEERLTLKHKNSSKWAKRILERGLAVQDEGTRAAISEQLQQHALLTRKMKSMKDGSSSDDSSEDEDDDDSYAGSDDDGTHKLLAKAKEKTAKMLEEEDKTPKSGVLSLPFMVRGMKKRKEAADEEAKLALQEFESSLKQLEDKNEAKSPNVGPSSGRRVFGAPKNQHQEESTDKSKKDKYYVSDSEDDFEAREHIVVTHGRENHLQKDMNIDLSILREESEINQDPMLKSFEDIVKDPGSKTIHEVAIFASNSWEKKKNLAEDAQTIKTEKQANVQNSSRVVQPDNSFQYIEEGDDGSDSDGEGHMVDGILSAGTKSNYELPSQTDLIRRAFAGDDVEEEFEKDKQGILNEETPEPEKPVLLPGWGQWTNIQRKRGLPSWMLAEHADAKKKREEALKKRKDAHLKHVIISEKIDKKAQKLLTDKAPYPFPSNEVFEQSLRVPIGPEFNPATSIGALNRPDVVKKTGVIIKPIKFEDVNPHERSEELKQGGKKERNKHEQKQVGKKQRIKSSGKAMKRKKTKV